MDMKDGHISCKRPTQPDVDTVKSVSVPRKIRKRAPNPIHTIGDVPYRPGRRLRLRKTSTIATLFHASTVRFRLLIERVPYPTGAFVPNSLTAIATLRNTALPVLGDTVVASSNHTPATGLTSPRLISTSQFPQAADLLNVCPTS